MTTPYYEDATVQLHHGDCLDVLRGLPDNSVDAVVTDPPYGLEFMGKEWDKFGTDTSNGYRETPRITDRPDAVSAYSTGGKGVNSFQAGRPFQQWCELWAAECLRVLKPGGHLLAFGGTRTWHRLACAVEDAGFEVRDSIAWMYGSGFPKSLDVSKAIDKRRTEDAEPVRAVCAFLRDALHENPKSRREIDAHFGTKNVGGHWFTPDSPLAQCPTWDQWLWLKGWLTLPDDMDAEVQRLNARKGAEGDNWHAREVTGTGQAGLTAGSIANFRGAKTFDLTAPATPDAERWQGWGTALKPAFEPVVVARKPLTGTVASNVLAWGTGALNIDGCRVGREEGDRTEYGRGNHLPHANTTASLGAFAEVTPYEPHTAGRWPANVVLDESQAAELDQMSGESASRAGGNRGESRQVTQGASNGGTQGGFNLKDAPRGGHDDQGGASRFFYVAKADTSERVRVAGVAHPTVKPLALMRWLVRLVTPPGGTVLEPFAGSGTTVEACIIEGFHCLAIERETDYLPLIVQRINRRRDPVAAVIAQGDDAGLFDLLDGEPA